MKPVEIIFLLLTITIATLVIFLLQPAILSKEWDLLAANSRNIEDWRNQLMWPSLYINFAVGILATLFWIAKGSMFQAYSGEQTLSTEGMWWIFCLLCALVSLVTILGLSFFHELIEEKDFIQFLIYLCGFAILDVLLLFWLPTAIATPRTMRYVPPGSQLLRSIYGG